MLYLKKIIKLAINKNFVKTRVALSLIILQFFGEIYLNIILRVGELFLFINGVIGYFNPVTIVAMIARPYDIVSIF